MKKIYTLSAVVMALAIMTTMADKASAATISSIWYTSPQSVDSNFTLLATYKGNTTNAFKLTAFDSTGRVIEGHKFGMPFIKNQGIQLDITSLPNQNNNHVYAFNTYSHDVNGRLVTDRYNLNPIRNFDTAYITLVGKPDEFSQVTFLIMEIDNADGTVAQQQFGTPFDTSQTGFAQMIIKARNLTQGQTLNVYPVFRGYTQRPNLDSVSIQIDFYSSN